MLGNHYIKWKNTYGFRFAVWAPHAKAVSVVGDFNNWDESKHPLTKITNEGLWAGFITNVFEYSNYKYAIRTANNDVILKADPYARQAELRPKTASVTRKPDGYIWNDQEWYVKKQLFNPYTSPISIYEVHLGSWKKKILENFYI